MTKERAPVTIENTLYRVLGELTIELAAETTGRAESYLRALSDPDKRERLTIEDAIKLDLAWRAGGREGFPLYETFGRIIESEAAERFADADALGLLTQDYARESGEATAWLIAAMQPGASLDTLRRALKECEEADTACTPAIANLRDRIRRKTSGAAPDTS
ncbi:hypothetical protein SAMN05192583_1020 [Sphingomonas gellani]|uniref:Uncharacterized protein n=1 Tax=Sphingomonas gellani TaxID=1166340 RepID=A0A1H8AQL4_9SPHN|nr:hypothetical protein [Sphingomonas gellani]SEM73015.1 hypothetical protein SAMN05192583_1020 [Sphingomonas gellani]